MSDAERLILRYYAAFNSGDRSGMIACLTDQVVHDVNEGGRRTGKAMFVVFMQQMDRCYREELRDIVVMVSKDGARASAEFVVHGTYVGNDEGLPPATGQVYILPAGSFLEIRGGLISRVTTYYNLNNWLKQVAG